MNRPLKPDSISHRCPRLGLYLAAASFLAAPLALPTPAAAVQFEAGNFDGSFDNTLSYGTTWRVQGRDRDLLGLASTTLPNGTVPPGGLGGRAFSVNSDDGNLNYDTGLVSNVVKLTSELALDHRSGFGAFVRGTAFSSPVCARSRRCPAPILKDSIIVGMLRIKVRIPAVATAPAPI